MKHKLAYFFLYQTALLFWCFKLHAHYFEFTYADQAALVVAALLPLLLLNFNINLHVKSLWFLLGLLPIVLLPIIQNSLSYFSDAWILIYAVLLIGGSVMLISRPSNLALISIFMALLVWVLPFSFQPNQVKYYDRLTQTISTRNGEVDIVTWKNDQWFYYNNALVISTIDGHIHSETLAHTMLPLLENPRVLLIGDDFGFTKKEIEKYPCHLTHLPFDAELSKELELPLNSTQEIFDFLRSSEQEFDVIIIDLPDPEQVVFKHYYEDYFYTSCIQLLSSKGLFITNAGSYYADQKHYQRIEAILQSHKMKTVVLQALVPTLGHRAWVAASRDTLDFDQIPSKVNSVWFNREALQLMLAKGRDVYPI